MLRIHLGSETPSATATCRRSRRWGERSIRQIIEFVREVQQANGIR